MRINWSFGFFFFLVLILALLILALWLEMEYCGRLQGRPSISSKGMERQPDGKVLVSPEVISEYEFYGCYNYENNIQWRGIFISSVIVTVILTFVIGFFYEFVLWELLAVMFFFTFFVFFFTGNLRHYHLYRNMASKVKGMSLI